MLAVPLEPVRSHPIPRPGDGTLLQAADGDSRLNLWFSPRLTRPRRLALEQTAGR